MKRAPALLASVLLLLLASAPAPAQDDDTRPSPGLPNPRPPGPERDPTRPEPPRPGERPELPEPPRPDIPTPPRPGEGQPGADRLPGGDVDPATAEELERLQLENPEELGRIQAELARIRRERAALQGEQEDLERQLRLQVQGSKSPVLAPRQEVVYLTLQDAVAQSLRNNPDYLVAYLQARAAQEEVPQAEGAFDPLLSFTGSGSRGRPPFFSGNPFSGFPVGLNTASFESIDFSTQLSKRFLTGTTVSVTWTERRLETENRFSLQPQYSPTLRLDVTQPLLRGFGPAVNGATIAIAENQARSSAAQLAATLMDGVLAVEDAYWNLVRAEEELEFQERSLTSALQLLEDQRKRMEAGAATPLEVTIAQAGVAERREAVIVAENALEAARDQIVRLTRPAADPGKWDLFVVPLDQPIPVEGQDVDPGRAIAMALEYRPEYRQAQLAIESARHALVVAENGALPVVDLFSSLQEEGLHSQHHGAWSSLGSGRFYTWTLGVRVDLPLFLRSERARARQALLDLEQAEASLAATEATIILDVRRSIRDIRTARQRIDATRASRLLAQERLEATRAQVKYGVAVNRDILDDLADLAQAESREVQALINYRLSLTRLQRAQGTLLAPWVDGLTPEVKRLLEEAEPVER